MLARLRQSTGIALFLALVMVAKLVGGYACLGENLAGAASDDSTDQITLADDGRDAGTAKSFADHADPNAAHAADGCCHCSCHQATALLGIEPFAQMQLRPPALPALPIVAISSRVERELRPPIV